MSMSLPAQILAGCCFLLCALPASAGNPAYEQRKDDYINQAAASSFSDAMVLQAYRGVPLDTAALQDIVNRIPANGVVDFDLVKLVRILYFTSGAYDSLLLPAMNSIPYWLTKGDTLRGYWSENHMIQWMSSDWLLHERYGRAIDATLDVRLRHYLRLKVEYGFYEFFSSVYAPYCLTGLLNLADFARDAEIRDLATRAAQRLLGDLLMLTNDRGVFFPAAGRNYYGKYEAPYGQNHNHLIYLLTGFGEAPAGASHAGSFLATSTIEADSVMASWTPVLDTIYRIGHSLDSGFAINSRLSHLDRVMFQWSSGAYFHPAVAQETAELLRDSSLWNHIDFAPFRSFSGLPIPTIVSLCHALSNVSESSVISGEDVVIFKHHSITLSSIKDFWKGKVGFQQFPCVANIGNTAVMTASGKVEHDWNDRSSTNANEHLPYVNQKRNVALIMYHPEISELQSLLPFRNPEVALHFKDADFDEVTEDGLWLLGRQGNNYIAVRRSCIGEINGLRACAMDSGQTWVLVAGDSGMYGSFGNFQSVIHQSQFTEEWYSDSQNRQPVYHAKIVVDTISIEYVWRDDDTAVSAMAGLPHSNSGFRVYPNPASTEMSIDLSSVAEPPVNISMKNMLGQELYGERLNHPELKHIVNIEDFPDGMYFIVIETPDMRFVRKLFKD